MIGIFVYRLVTSFVNNPQDHDLLAMRVRLARGDTIAMPLPSGAFWVKYYSTDPTVPPPTIELRGNGTCRAGDGLRAKRVLEGEYAKYCRAGTGTTIVIGHGAIGADTVSGTIALELNSR